MSRGLYQRPLEWFACTVQFAKAEETETSFWAMAITAAGPELSGQTKIVTSMCCRREIVVMCVIWQSEVACAHRASQAASAAAVLARTPGGGISATSTASMDFQSQPMPPVGVPVAFGATSAAAGAPGCIVAECAG
jgi:hypothetical protein